MRTNRIMLSTSVLGLAFSLGCPPPTGCPPVILHGIRVDLTDAQTDAPISGATLTLSEGNYTEAMQESGSGVYLGAFGRPGTYTLTVQADGYEDLSETNLQAGTDQCGVVTTTHPVQINPL